MTSTADPGSTAPPEWYTTALAAPVTERQTTVAGVPIAYRVWGEPTGRGIVLVHGGAAHSRWWDHIGPLLASDRQVVALDLSGHGDSGRRASYSIDVWAEEVLAVAADTGLDAPVPIGHSMGGLVALRIAALSGHLIAGAVTIEAFLREPGPETRAAHVRRFRAQNVYPSREAAIAQFRPVPSQPVLSYIADHVAATSVREVEGGWTWKWDPGIAHRDPKTVALNRIDCRLAVLRAEHGPTLTKLGDDVRDRHGRVPPVIEIPAARHQILLDQPLALVAAIRTVLSHWDQSLSRG